MGQRYENHQIRLCEGFQSLCKSQGKRYESLQEKFTFDQLEPVQILKNFDVGETKVLRKMLSLLTDQEWKEVRAALSPTFTTGKIKRVNTIRSSNLGLDVSSVSYV